MLTKTLYPHSPQLHKCSHVFPLQVYSHQPTSENELLTYISVGEVCAACTSMRKWCRAKVMKIMENQNESDVESEACHSKDEVEVLLIDYGKVVKTKVKCVISTLLFFSHVTKVQFAMSTCKLHIHANCILVSR